MSDPLAIATRYLDTWNETDTSAGGGASPKAGPTTRATSTR